MAQPEPARKSAEFTTSYECALIPYNSGSGSRMVRVIAPLPSAIMSSSVGMVITALVAPSGVLSLASSTAVPLKVTVCGSTPSMNSPF